MLGVKVWLRFSVSVHPKGVGWDSGRGFVQSSYSTANWENNLFMDLALCEHCCLKLLFDFRIASCKVSAKPDQCTTLKLSCSGGPAHNLIESNGLLQVIDPSLSPCLNCQIQTFSICL